MCGVLYFCFWFKDCFACLNDGSCIDNGKFCDMSMDCLDNSDEKNCGKYI